MIPRVLVRLAISVLALVLVLAPPAFQVSQSEAGPLCHIVGGLGRGAVRVAGVQRRVERRAAGNGFFGGGRGVFLVRRGRGC